MSEKIIAVYGNGILRPLTPVSLPEGTRVTLEVLPSDSEEQEKTLQMLSDIQITYPSGKFKTPPPMTEEERTEFLNRIGQTPGKPLSEIIIEEREQQW